MLAGREMQQQEPNTPVSQGTIYGMAETSPQEAPFMDP
jgi:hypothetical protein